MGYTVALVLLPAAVSDCGPASAAPACDTENWPARWRHAEDGRRADRGHGEEGELCSVRGTGHAHTAGQMCTGSWWCVCTRELCNTSCASVSFHLCMSLSICLYTLSPP